MSTRSYQHPLDPDVTMMEIDPAPRKPASKWRLWRRAVFGAIGGVGIYLLAIFANQGPVEIHDGPVIQAVSLDCYRLVQAFDTEFTVRGVTYRISVRAGYVYDGATIPAALRYPLGLDPFSGCLARAALVHDALYGSELLARDIADEALLVLALQDGTDPRKARAIHRAVSDAGGLVWDRHTVESVAKARTYVKVIIQ
jgi:hypothetical protein